MQIEAIYQNGRLEFTRPIQLKEGPVHLLVEVSPDDVAETIGAATEASEDTSGPQVTSEQPQALTSCALPSDVVARLEQRRRARADILGRPPMSEPDQALSEKQQLRMRAFAGRQAWCNEQGRC